MLILDTDHLVEYQKGTSAESRRLKERLAQQSQPFGTTIISVEEIMRGWMAAIRRVREPVLRTSKVLRIPFLDRLVALGRGRVVPAGWVGIERRRGGPWVGNKWMSHTRRGWP